MDRLKKNFLYDLLGKINLMLYPYITYIPNGSKAKAGLNKSIIEVMRNIAWRRMLLNLFLSRVSHSIDGLRISERGGDYPFREGII